ncbi:MAG TPA: hypothetical protein DDW90_03340 [Cyanobacteria bacterium UBA9971]|nr:hypothetical protein [Cyanobacteria bacterium UBA9971]
MQKFPWSILVLTLLIIFVSISDYINLNVILGNHFNPTLLSGVFTGLITLCAMWFIDEKQARRLENNRFIEQYCVKLFAFKKALQDFTYVGCRNHSKLPKIFTEDFDKITFADLSKTIISVSEECGELRNYCIFFEREANIKSKKEFKQIDTLTRSLFFSTAPILAFSTGSKTQEEVKFLLRENFSKALLEYMPEKDLKKKFSLYKQKFNKNNLPLIHQIVIEDIRKKALNIHNIIGYKNL